MKNVRPLSNEEIRKLILTGEGEFDALLEQGKRAAVMACGMLSDASTAIAASAFLCRAARRDSLKVTINDALGSHEPLRALLEGSEPKLRKNAARLLGTLGSVKDVDMLIKALEHERQRWVRPSIILALGALGGEAATATVMALKMPVAKDETELKHVSEEISAIEKARSLLCPLEAHKFTGLKADTLIELRTMPGFARALEGEALEHGFIVANVFKNGITVKTRNYEKLFELRCFAEALFPVGVCAFEAEAVAAAAGNAMCQLLAATHEGTPPFSYRMELRGEYDRSAFSKALNMYMDRTKLHNSPSAYEAELRIEPFHSKCRLYVKLFNYEDKRFAYRLKSLPASMAPSSAAALIRYASPFLKENPRVLDPFVGSGTLLIERARFSPCEALHGIDISGAAVDIARANAEAAGVNARFVHNDCLRFKAVRPYDEIICNMPFGNRVGTHEINTELYAAFIALLPEWLTPDGVALLYTMEHALLRSLLLPSGPLALVDTARAYAGGLMPSVFILKKKN